MMLEKGSNILTFVLLLPTNHVTLGFEFQASHPFLSLVCVSNVFYASHYLLVKKIIQQSRMEDLTGYEALYKIILRDKITQPLTMREAGITDILHLAGEMGWAFSLLPSTKQKRVKFQA